MSSILKNYASAIVSGNRQEIAATLSPAIIVMPPGANQPNEGKERTSMMLSAVASAIVDYKAIRTYEAGDNWHAVLLEGSIDGIPVQFVDQVHIDGNDLVDHIDIFLRPAFMAENLLGRVTAEIKRRTSMGTSN